MGAVLSDRCNSRTGNEGMGDRTREVGMIIVMEAQCRIVVKTQ